jgi:hypothetical protein
MMTFKLSRPMVAAMILAAGACAPLVSGNERGGTISYAVADSAATVNAKVEEHCAKYGRRPSVQPNAQPGSFARANQYQFECAK